MDKMIAQILRYVRISGRNPIALAAFTLGITCLGYWYTFQIDESEYSEKIENNFVEISRLDGEIKRTNIILASWRNILIKNHNDLKNLDELEKKPANQIDDNDTRFYFDFLKRQRESLDTIIVQSSTMRLTNTLLSSIVFDIKNDALMRDSFVKSKMNFIIMVHKNFEKASEMVDEQKTSFEGLRRFQQVNEKLHESYLSLSVVVENYNSMIRKDKELRSSRQFKSNLATLSIIYLCVYVVYYLLIISASYFRQKSSIRVYNSNVVQKDLETDLQTINQIPENIPTGKLLPTDAKDIDSADEK